MTNSNANTRTPNPNQEDTMITISFPDNLTVTIPGQAIQSATMVKLKGQTLSYEEFCQKANKRAIVAVSQVYTKMVARRLHTPVGRQRTQSGTFALKKLAPEHQARFFNLFNMPNLCEIKKRGNRYYMQAIIEGQAWIDLKAAVQQKQGWSFGTTSGRIVITDRRQ